MKTKLYTALIATCFSLTIANAQWESTGIGPFGGAELIKVDTELRCLGIAADFSSNDNATTWTKDTLLGMGIYAYVTAIAKSTDTYFSGEPYGKIYASADAINWTLSYDLGLIAPVPYILADGNNIYAIIDGIGVLRSNDNGSSWVMGNGGLGGDSDNISQIVKVGSDLYISTLGGVFKSTDDGDNWVEMNSGLPDLMQCNGIGFTQGALLTSGYGFGVYRSTDMGESWTQVTAGFSDFLFVGGFYSSDDVTVVGGSTCKAHFTTDGGATWTLIAQGAGLGFDVFNGFLIDNGYLFAVTTNWPLRVSLEDLGITKVNVVDTEETHVQIAPNPASSHININLDEKAMSHVEQMEIIDLKGRIVASYLGYTNTIDVSSFQNGIYILKICTPESQLQKQFIINK